MRRVVVTEWMSLDGVVQAPAYPDEDTSGGFAHGGWHLKFFEPVAMKWVTDNVQNAGGFIFGRRTFESFAGYWPKASKDEEPLSRPLNEVPKYVASTTLKAPLAWNNARLLEADVPEAVAALKRESGRDLLVIGSTVLVHTLLLHDLVDELRLMIDPILLGGGKRAFRDDGVLRSWKLVDGQITATGAILAKYARSQGRS